MYQYYITEVRETASGEFEHENFWAFDEVKKKAELKGEAKYHEVMARAAVSTYAHHSAILFSSDAVPIMFGSYDHTEGATE